VTLLLSDADVRRAVDEHELVEAIETAFKADAAGEVVQPTRMNLEYSGSWLRMMPAIVPSAGIFGLKAFHGAEGHGTRYLVIIYDLLDGVPLAIIDACYLTAARTAATTAVASMRLSRSDASRVAILGSGLEATTHCKALAAVTEIEEFRVFSPNESRRAGFAKRMQDTLGIRFGAYSRPEEAIDGADVVVVATNTGPSSGVVACRASWLTPGQSVLSIGSTNPQLRELETDVLRSADLLVVDADAASIAVESGDVIEYCAKGGRIDHAVTLSEIVAGRTPGRTAPEQLSVFKSVGSALQDVVAAGVVYRRAKDLGLGLEVPDVSLEKS
jgi:ornithine cyclodeaminase/alanine dehydrogenase-like protein (mu-crystallin family)